jgi:lon-related putative ATP-dependent protease
MADVKPLSPRELCRSADASRFAWQTTADLADLPGLLGQDRAVEALGFGLGLRRDGFNVFALGPSGVGKLDAVRRTVEQAAADAPTPSEWAYVANFADPRRPRALELPAGRAAPLRRAMEKLLEELRAAIPASFESDDYRGRRKLLDERANEQGERAFSALQKDAEAEGIAVLRTPMGVAMAPTRNGEVMEPDEFQKLPEADQERLKEALARLQKRLQELLSELPALAARHREVVRKLNQEVAAFTVSHLLEGLRASFADVPAVGAHLDALQADVLENLDEFVAPEKAEGRDRRTRDPRPLRRYSVNVIVDHECRTGAPVVHEDHPSHGNLLGRVEHLSEFGSLVTDLTLIQGGALHRANGGYLLLDARRLLQQPYAWEELKRALRSRQIRIRSLGELLSFISTVTLEPEPIPLDVKVLLVGDRMIYYLLAEYDPEFLELFKVAADFDESFERTPQSEDLYARLLATLARRAGLLSLDRSGVARTIDHAVRLAGDAERLSTRTDPLTDLLREADHRARARGAAVLEAGDVQAAIDGQERRAGRIPERMLDQVRDGTVLIDTRGAVVGQVNGLTVMQLGGHTFGRPARITASVRLGAGGKVLDIEKEVALGGPIHSKGVLILSGFLGARFGAERPLSLQASLVFEQSYGGVEGDSASCAELVVLLSAIAGVPIKQSIALTGSVNQHGQVQAVGGVTEKVEGFFDVCRAAGLRGDEGVVLPASNVRHLMLRRDVVEAAERGQFRVYPVSTVDEAIELLTGLPAGERGPDGAYPEGSFNARVEARLRTLTEKAKAFAAPEKKPEAAS